MKLRILSDIHLENCKSVYKTDFLKWVIPSSDSDKDSVLILAGDIINFNIPDTWIQLVDYVKDKFKAVIKINGNHEFYNSDLAWGDILFKEYIENIDNFYYLNNNLVKIDDILFVGSTLWTDFNKNNPNTKITVQFGLNDYNYIKNNGQLLTADMIYKEHLNTYNFLSQYQIENKHPKEKIVVITHHLPSLQCIDQKYRNSGDINYGFASDLDSLILQIHSALWISGHTHCSYDFNINSTRLICNPLGYSNFNTKNAENKNFNNKLILEV